MSKYPLIQGILTQNGGGGENSSQVPFVYEQRKTPAEVMLLLHVHNAAIGSDDEVISDAKWTGEIEIAEADLRRDLSNKYGAKLVQTMFPGSLPTTTHYPDCREEWLAAHEAAQKVISGAQREAEDVDQAPKADTLPDPVLAPVPDEPQAPLEHMSFDEVKDLYKDLHPEGKAAPNFWDEDIIRFKAAKMQREAERAD